MIFPSLRVTADAEGGLKSRALVRPVLQGFGGGLPPTSERRVYTGALLAATLPRNQYQVLPMALECRSFFLSYFWMQIVHLSKLRLTLWSEVVTNQN